MTAGTPPLLLIKGKPASGYNAVEMVMIEQSLAPGMQHGAQADLSFKFCFSELKQCGAGRLKEQLVERALVLADQWVEQVRQSEDDVEVRHWQETGALFGQPVLRS